MKNRVWLLIFGAVIALCAGAWLFLPRSAGDAVAGIYQDGVLIRAADLRRVEEIQTFTIAGESGENTVELSPGGIRVVEADCPDKTCVAHGYLKKEGPPIICLPNRLVIKWISGADLPYDAMTGT